MATLALTVVGGAIGGPIGAMIGAVVGQQADAAIFAPRGREGPRLTDLAIQTSSYGSQVPKLFGTMRVAGTVIWATELKENRSTTGGGKGRSATTSYSYSASFAVLLSARPVRRVLRIWADGKLLRGAAGDWKTSTGFRLHTGDPDQPIDPLIASAEGMAGTPAHRGHAYAVFEDMALGEFGNRIPSLTFEIEADAGTIDAGTIVDAIAPEVGGTAGGPQFGGFAAAGESKRGVVETLAEVSGGWIASDRHLFWRVGTEAAQPLEAVNVAAEGEERIATRLIAPAYAAPTGLVMRHHDPSRDYQVGSQRVRRAGSGAQEIMIDAPMAMAAEVARGLALAAIERRDAGRETRTIALDWRWMGIAPGAIAVVTGEAGRWRVRAVTVERMVVRVDLVRLAFGAVPVPASSGQARVAPDLSAGQTRIAVIELPPAEGVASTPQLFVAACGTGAGWRGAALSTSIDDGASWQAAGRTAEVAVMGRIETAVGAAPATLIDRNGTFEITLTNPQASLTNADIAALDMGANLAMVGDELMQFGRAEPVGAGRWRLSELWRGRRGTEFAIGAQLPGDRFVLIEQATLLPLSGIGAIEGRAVRVSAIGTGDGEGGIDVVEQVTGWSVRPPMPVHGRVVSDGMGERRASWVRRSRDGWHWRDLIDVPLAEERERYRVTWNGVETTTEVAQLVVADDASGLEVRQQGTAGVSLPLVITAPERS
ncbi:phage tail protein [Sphingomonas sp. AX6]|uniref:phage tail protein n=1 Tax=Sphingomonas sp. AX6 TaxID=2653171 RepID=UPI0012F28FAA|nr:phage tail protein [Sphingomonas sp. AX6]VXC68641.1 Phage Host Specificity Protein [Sphingomonas sp. AX6]